MRIMLKMEGVSAFGSKAGVRRERDEVDGIANQRDVLEVSLDYLEIKPLINHLCVCKASPLNAPALPGGILCLLYNVFYRHELLKTSYLCQRERTREKGLRQGCKL